MQKQNAHKSKAYMHCGARCTERSESKHESCQTSSKRLTRTVFNIFLVVAFLLCPPSGRREGVAHRSVATSRQILRTRFRVCTRALSVSIHTQQTHSSPRSAWVCPCLLIMATIVPANSNQESSGICFVSSGTRQGLFSEARGRCTP